MVARFAPPSQRFDMPTPAPRAAGNRSPEPSSIETGFAPDWLQYELTDPFDSAKPIRTDFAWERQARELTLGELDGLIKYTDQTMLAGRTTAEALVAERQREAHLSLYGHPLLRFTMNEVRSAGMLAKKLQTAGIRQTALPTWLNEVDL